eukprot:570307-Amorphochlora_amoeboformis.AAC.1
MSRKVLNFLENTAVFAKAGSVTWREVTLCHGISGSPVLPGTTRHYRQGNPRAISGISSDLQLSIAYVRPY